MQPSSPFFRIPLQAARAVVRNDGFLLSSTLAYTALLSLFPFIIFLSALAGLLSHTPTMQKLINDFFIFAPPEVAGVLQPVIVEIIQTQSGGLLTLGILGALWAMLSGTETLRYGLNRAYDVAETRSFWWRYVQSLLFVVVLGSMLLLVSLLLPLGPVLSAIIEGWFVPSPGSIMAFSVLRYVATALMVLAATGILYCGLPNLTQNFSDVLPGAATATVLWVVLGSLFSVYLTHFNRYGVTYGSLSGIIITLLFFQVTALILLFGAEINQALKRDAQDDLLSA